MQLSIKQVQGSDLAKNNPGEKQWLSASLFPWCYLSHQQLYSQRSGGGCLRPKKTISAIVKIQEQPKRSSYHSTCTGMKRQGPQDYFQFKYSKFYYEHIFKPEQKRTSNLDFLFLSICIYCLNNHIYKSVYNIWIYL